MFKYIFLALFLQAGLGSAQDFKRMSYCQCEARGEKLEESNSKDTVYSIVNSISSNGLNVSFYNNTADTIFLFKSYFDDDISVSKYLYRYSKNDNQLNVSFIPLLPYLSTKYSDRIVMNNRVIVKNQIVYDFYKIAPYSVYNFNLKVNDLKSIRNAVQQINPHHLSKFDSNIKFKACNSLPKKMKYSLQLAYYKNIQTICDEQSYYLKEREFNNQANSFVVIDSEIPLTK